MRPYAYTWLRATILCLRNLSALLDSNTGDDNNNESSMSDSDEACKELLMDDIDAIEVDDDTLDVILQTGETEAGNLEGLEVPEKDIVLDNYCVFLPGIHITIVKDRSYYLPLLQISLWRISFVATGATSK